MIKKLFWTLPFLACALGYFAASRVVGIRRLEVPRVVGLPVTEGVKVLSSHKLNVRIVHEQEDPELPDGTILQQSPNPRTAVKPQHSIFLVTSKRPQPQEAPCLVGKTRAQTHEMLSKMSIK